MKIIEVIPNPYIALDKDGVPQGVVGAGAPGLYVGAELDLVATQKTGKMRFFYPLDKAGSFKKKVHLTADIGVSIRAGELIVCDRAVAATCGITAKEFLEPEEALAAERVKALKYWQALHGDEKGPNKSVTVADIPRAASVLKAGEVLPAVSPNANQLTDVVKLTKNKEV